MLLAMQWTGRTHAANSDFSSHPGQYVGVSKESWLFDQGLLLGNAISGNLNITEINRDTIKNVILIEYSIKQTRFSFLERS